MRSFRSKPVGWRGESHRHYLAAKYGKSGYGKSGYPVQSSVVPRTKMMNIIEETMVGHPEDVRAQKEYEAGVLKQAYVDSSQPDVDKYGPSGSWRQRFRNPLRGELVLGTPRFEEVVRLKDLSQSAAARAKYEEPEKETEFLSLGEFQKSAGEYGDELKGQEGPAGFVERILTKEKREYPWKEYKAEHPGEDEEI